MAHALRYYKDLEQPNGTIIRLEIHRKKDGDAILVSKEIGRVVQALHLDIQGGADTIDAPIVKTSLTMTFVDAPDLEPNKKCGDWEEFYTPDSTMWKVVLKADGKAIWSGYVTPDSYQEDLRYRGSVTIIARDNIGHMQDFPFDMEGNADGMVTLQELVNEAWAKIESPMTLDWRHEADDADYLLCDGVEAPQTYMNVSAFEDMNYFDAVEKALYSYGLVMRFVGSNRVAIMSLRDLPYQGKSGAPRPVEPTFLAHAQRELAPAVRRIEESVKYEFSDGIEIPLAKGVTFSGAAYTVPFYSKNIFGEITTTNIPVHAITNTSGEGWGSVPSATLFFNPKNYTIADAALKEDAERMLFLATNTNGMHSATYRKTMICRNFRIDMTFGRVVQRRGDIIQYCYGFASGTENSGIGSIRVNKVSCYISVDQNGITQFYNGNGWQTDAYRIELEQSENGFGIDIGFYGMTGAVALSFTIENIELDAMRDYSDGDGLYVPISSMYWGAVASNSLCETNNVNTVYIDTNNVILDHSPELGPALDEVPFPSVIKNGIFVKSGNAYLPAKKWAWSGGTPQQMAVYNHLQLLCYHSEPNNVISGDIVYADFVDMAAIYEWGGANHILVSGSYNCLNGHIESAVLREFQWYNDMWGDANLPEVEEDKKVNVGTVRPGSSSGGSTGGGGTSGGGGGEGGGSITVDSAMSDTSTNPVQNKVVKKYVDDAETRAKKYTDDTIAQIETDGGSIKVDTEMSGTSVNAVQNKVIKAYIDKHPQYEVIEDIEVPDLPEGSQGSVDLTGYATEQWVENKGYATRSWVNGRKFVTEQWVGNQGFVDKAYVGSQINAYASNTYALIAALEERITALEKMLEGVDGASGCYFIPTGVTFADDIVSVSYDRVGEMVEPLTVKTIAKITGSIPCAKESTVSSSLANFVTMFNENDLSIVYVPGNQYTIEITVVTSDSNGTTTKKESFTFTA